MAEVLADRHAGLFALVEPLAKRANEQPKTLSTEEENFALGEVVKAATEAFSSIEGARVEEKAPFLRDGKIVDDTFRGPKERLDKIIKGLSARADAYAHQKKLEARRKALEEEQKLRDEEERLRRLATFEADIGDTDAAEVHAEIAETVAFRASQAAETTTARAADLTRARSDTGMLATASDKWDFRVADWSKVDIAALRPYLTVDVLEKALRAHIRTHKGSMPIAGVEFVEMTKASFR
ncbi:vacuolar-type H+-ATPase subunit I/STV1 [Angulomicrobium amanitiforme]|uniref:Vacuolar-type H+-ATPase subunit I/STV1 n=1 Tax=Ancylobacter amanitiformis TaxID=217069 RepID=A0ABU0LQJ5_9HYPH|nr:vacuolar-type H+-ATPase subunit I/STV1 [Ancylobacter amanitiformis]